MTSSSFRRIHALSLSSYSSIRFHSLPSRRADEARSAPTSPTSLGRTATTQSARPEHALKRDEVSYIQHGEVDLNAV